MRRIQINRDGSFHYGNLTPGTYELRANVAPGYVVVSGLRLTQSRSDLVLRLPDGKRGKLVVAESMSDVIEGRVLRLARGGKMFVEVPVLALITHGSIGVVLRDGVTVGHIRVTHATREALICDSLSENRQSIGREFAYVGDRVEFR